MRHDINDKSTVANGPPPFSVKSKDCFEKAFKYIEDLDRFSAGHISFSEIAGIFLVSEDTTALPEAKNIVRRYFGKVKSDKVVQLVAAGPVPSAKEGEVDLSSSCGNSDDEVSCSVRCHRFGSLKAIDPRGDRVMVVCVGPETVPRSSHAMFHQRGNMLFKIGSCCDDGRVTQTNRQEATTACYKIQNTLSSASVSGRVLVG